MSGGYAKMDMNISKKLMVERCEIEDAPTAAVDFYAKHHHLRMLNLNWQVNGILLRMGF